MEKQKFSPMELHDDVRAAYNRIKPFVLKTPLMESIKLGKLHGNKVFIKLGL